MATPSVDRVQRLEAALAAAEAAQRDLQQRLVALVAASGTLFGSPKLADMMPAVIVLARTLIPADGYALWRLDPDTQTWQIGASAGISETFTSLIIEQYRGQRVSAVPFTEPLVAKSVDDEPLLGERTKAYRAEGIESMLAMPLTIGKRATGTLVLYHRTRHEFTEIEIHTARALGTLAAAAIATAQLYEEQQRSRERAERSNQQAAFLAEAGAALASSLDYEATLRTVAAMAVPHIADWCAVDLVDEQEIPRRVAVAHVDPARAETGRTFRDRFPDDPNSRASLAYVIRTGTPTLVPQVTDELLQRVARDEEHLRALRELEIAAYICVPLVAHGRRLGALTLVSSESKRQYDQSDLRVAQELAYRAALAVENARAYHEANAANRAKDEFLAMLSHELRTPLNAVLGWTRMLRTGSVTPAKMSRAFQVIERNAVAQLDLVEDLLDLSRIITGKFRLDVQPVPLRAAVDAAVEAVQPAATAKAIALGVRNEAPADVVLGDGARLQQVVWNLLSNAIKFTPRDGRVEVVLAARDALVEISVTDTGEGIDPAVLPFVFDRFRQADSGPTRSHMGLGLGLAIVRHIIELHGGRVGATSAGKGCGATFTISLPALGAPRPAVPLDTGALGAAPAADVN
jgi:signal transduction histidine kinase